MTYLEHSARLAVELGQLAVTASSTALDRAGLDLAMGTRRETIELLRTVLADTTGISREHTGIVESRRSAGDQRRVEELERHPVGMLSRTLAAHPAPQGRQSLMDAFASPANPSPAREGWARAGRHAVLATHEWSVRRPRSSPDQHWSAVADVAAVAQAVVVLDLDLLDVARRLPGVDPAVVDALEDATTSGLKTAAREAASLAATGPLPPWGEPGPDAQPTRVMMVRSSGDLVAAQRRLPLQVADSTHLAPRAVVTLATGQGRLLATAAEGLRSVDGPRAEQALQVARQLTAAVTSARQLAALQPDDPRPVTQTGEMVRHLGRVAAEGWTPEVVAKYQPALAALVDHCPAVVEALARSSKEAVRTGQWIVPNTVAVRAQDPLWRLSTRADPDPKVCVELHAVAARAQAALGSPVTSGPAAPAPSMAPPRQTLAQIAEQDRRTRPVQPGTRYKQGLQQQQARRDQDRRDEGDRMPSPQERGPRL